VLGVDVKWNFYKAFATSRPLTLDSFDIIAWRAAMKLFKIIIQAWLESK
jgi:hypothetical protein